ncbi:SIS domain-containing protein [Elusimicrobiota bacterium]
MLEKAKSVLKEEAQALKRAAELLNEDFSKAADLIRKTEGKTVVMGMGKSGLIGRKIAATLSSTGTPALFLHAAESLHGDIGVINSADIVLILSYSGTTDEIALVLPAIKRRNVPIISITGNRDSDLGKNSDIVIELDIQKEACPMNLVPTTSTTVMLALGDALAIALLEERGFKPSDFAELHPAGTLGKKLLLTVGDIVEKSGVNPVVNTGATVKDALMVMTQSRVGATSVVDGNGNLIGYFTDGDLRRKLQEDIHIMDRKIEEVMTANPTSITSDRLAMEARELIKNKQFDNLPVVDGEGRPVGIIDERDIIKEGL